MPEHKEGDQYTTDTRVVEQFHTYRSKIGTMGGWKYDEKLFKEHCALIAEEVFGWNKGRHYHDECGACRNLDDVAAMYESDGCGGLFEELVNSCQDFTVTKTYVELEKTDPLRKYHYITRVTINGHDGHSLYDGFGSALWHAMVNWAIANRARKENNETV